MKNDFHTGLSCLLFQDRVRNLPELDGQYLPEEPLNLDQTWCLDPGQARELFSANSAESRERQNTTMIGVEAVKAKHHHDRSRGKGKTRP